MYETANDVVVKAALLGLKPEDVDICIRGDVLTIKGKRKEEKLKEQDYFCREFRYRAFSRSITILLQVMRDKAGAVFENGIFILTLPKAEEIKPK